MRPTLRIKNYKRIGTELRIENFERFNYFVGRNGSGKSSVLNALSHLNDGLSARGFFSDKSIVELTMNGKRRQIIWQAADKDPNHTSQLGDLHPLILVPYNNFQEKGGNGVLKCVFNYIKMAKETLDFLNETSKIIGGSPIKAQRVINNDDPWDDSVGERIFRQDNITVSLEFLSDGLKSMNDLRYNLSSSFRYMNRGELETADVVLIIIEEPENNLHPDMQEKIPDLLSAFLMEEIESGFHEKICFCISTHSPFLISAAAGHDGSKVYFMGDGSLLDLGLNSVESSSGYTGHQCAAVVANMLGGNVTDLGYPENYCVLEEFSMQLILQDAKEKGLIKNIQFVSASGVSRIVSLSKTLDEIGNLDTLMKCNPFYVSKYLVVVDSLKELEPKEVITIKKIQTRLGKRFIELNEDGLEKYYKNLDVKLSEEFEAEIKSVTGANRGAVKAKYAARVAGKVKSASDFSKLFNGELDILLS